MKLESQVVSLEIAKKLKELGVKQESSKYWCRGKTNGDIQLYNEPLTYIPLTKGDFRQQQCEHFSAFTVAELGLLLPQLTKSWQSAFGWYSENPSIAGDRTILPYDTEADARGKCLTYLLENKLI